METAQSPWWGLTEVQGALTRLVECGDGMFLPDPSSKTSEAKNVREKIRGNTQNEVAYSSSRKEQGLCGSSLHFGFRYI